jgi:hypothetical protein
MKKPKVILRRAPVYDPAAIEAVIRGCPPKHKSLVLMMFLKLGILNPLFRVGLIWDAYVCLFFSWVRRFFKGTLWDA